MVGESLEKSTKDVEVGGVSKKKQISRQDCRVADMKGKRRERMEERRVFFKTLRHAVVARRWRVKVAAPLSLFLLSVGGISTLAFSSRFLVDAFDFSFAMTPSCFYTIDRV